MTTKARLALYPVLVLTLSLACASQPSPQEKAAFETLARRYLMAGYAFNPSFATQWGIHDYDDSLENWTPERIHSEEQRVRDAMKELETIRPAKLDPATRIDYDLLRTGMRANLYFLTEGRGWENDPSSYNYGGTLMGMISVDYEPLDQRMRSLTRRLEQVPRQLTNARLNLKNPPELFTQIAAEDFEGTISFLENDVTRAFASVPNPTLRAEFEAAKKTAIAATKDHIAWMRSTLLPASHGSFVLGEDRYRKRLRYEEMIDLPIDTLLAVGQRELDRLEARYKEALQRVDPSATPDAIVARMRADHPSADSILDYARALCEEARAFTIQSGFIKIPDNAHITVRPTPEFAASRSFASFDAPGPFETKADDAYYNITLPDPKWPKQQIEEHLQGFSRWTLPSVSVHEVYPGHYVHHLYGKRAPSMVRKSIGSGAFAEGWGLYTEEGLLDQGFRKDDPRVAVGVMRWALVRACRLQVGIRIHTRGMSLEDGTKFFMEHAGLERANAEREAGRAAFDPTYSVYTLGALEIRKLRDDYRREQGANFNLGQFHETILSQGALPVALLRTMLLKNEGTIL
ncbi:MAG TPA: DUF885 domain-containing protein [Candidatus Eisenbacteria bacterium]|nr:DUF885 domain-containing protein [Candidatus Eisenbacteria bacterium]